MTKLTTFAGLVLFAGFALPLASDVSPIEKVVEMLSGMESKIIAEGKDAQKVYAEFAEFCEDRSREVAFEIKTGKAEITDLTAAIEKESASIESLNAKIEEISAALATDEADLKAAGEIRAKEKAVFEEEQAKLEETIDTLSRAISILEREMAQAGGASMLQWKGAQSVTQALSAIVSATSLSTADASTLASLLQSSQESEEDDEEPGAPAATVYKSQSGNIVETCQGLYDKAEAQLDDLRKSETKNNNAYQLLKQSLQDSIKFADKDMNKAKKGLAASEEAKATAEGDLEVTTKDLKADEESLASLHSECMSGAEDFEAETKSRGEELKALATAKKIINETTGGAADLSYSFVQVSMTSRADLANFEAVRFVRDLAHKYKAAALTQLATRMAAAMRGGNGAGDSPFAKVEGLIKDMIERLEAEAEKDATEKAFCDKEMEETEEKKADKEETIEKLSTEIDSMSTKSAKLKEEVATLQKELAELARAQAEMDKLRGEEKAAFETDSAEMKMGLEGVKRALKVLNEYYAKNEKVHGADEGGASGVIGLLEVCESDFSKGLAEMVAAEEAAEAAYEKQTKENEITKAAKDQDVKYKTKEFKGLDKAVAEATDDRSTVQDELDAVNEYYKELQGRCIAKAETYEERVKRRDAEIAGLKQALEILNGEAVLLQRSSKHTLRGAKVHA
jgi:predicted RNase H-like nuclease (RuvC/YqgF family)